MEKSKDKLIKRIEYFFKDVLERFIFKDIHSVLIEKKIERFAFFDDSKILLIRNDRIGDLLVSTPLLKTLRKKYPNVVIDILLSDKNIAARRSSDNFVNNTYIYIKKLSKMIPLILSLRKRKYDLVIDLLDNPSTTNAFIIKFIKPLYSLGFRKAKTNKYNLEVILPPKLKVHIVDRINQLLLPFDIESNKINENIEFLLAEQEVNEANSLLGYKNTKYRIGINLAGSNTAKFWGIDNYISFIKYLDTTYKSFEIVLFHTNQYKQVVAKILNVIPSLNAPITENFNVYAAMIAECDILLSPDTAAVHLAAAFQVPCIALYQFSGTKETGMPWTPYHSPAKVIKTGTNSLSNIHLDAVIECFEEAVIEYKLYE